MSLEAKTNNTVLTLNYIGEDFWSSPVYRDQFNRLWKDIELGACDPPVLCSTVNNEYDDEPDEPIRQEFIIEQPNPINNAKRFQYQLLGRMKSDCDYYLGYGNRNPGRLWANNETEHIKTMKSMWLSFSEEEKPEWLTWEQILEYEKEMCVKQ